MSRSTAQLIGPAIAGVAIQAIGAARAVSIDAASYLVSALSLWLIKKPEPEPKPGSANGKTGFWHEMWEGIQIVIGNPTLWKIAGCTATWNLGSNMAFAVELIFLYRYLTSHPRWWASSSPLAPWAACSERLHPGRSSPGSGSA